MMAMHHLNRLVHGKAQDKADALRRAEAWTLCKRLSPAAAPLVFRLAMDGRFDSVIQNLK
jgi:hypothetical protein